MFILFLSEINDNVNSKITNNKVSEASVMKSDDISKDAQNNPVKITTSDIPNNKIKPQTSTESKQIINKAADKQDNSIKEESNALIINIPKIENKEETQTNKINVPLNHIHKELVMPPSELKSKETSKDNQNAPNQEISDPAAKEVIGDTNDENSTKNITKEKTKIVEDIKTSKAYQIPSIKINESEAYQYLTYSATKEKEKSVEENDRQSSFEKKKDVISIYDDSLPFDKDLDNSLSNQTILVVGAMVYLSLCAGFLYMRSHRKKKYVRLPLHNNFSDATEL